MKFKFSWFILFLVLFVPFEVIILKYLPVSDAVYGYLRFLVEVIIYALAGILFLRYLLAGNIPKGTNIDRPLLIFVLYAIMQRQPLLHCYYNYKQCSFFSFASWTKNITALCPSILHCSIYNIKPENSSFYF